MREQSRMVFRSIFRIKVADRDTGRLIGYVGDISEGGFKLLSDEPMELDVPVALQIRLRDGEGKMQMLDVEVICLWCQENIRTGYHESGCSLHQPSEEFARLVEGMRAKRASKSPS
ncbi:PilZ domain-containing protein [Pseudomonas sp. WN033]|nr:PilZ domain-containing protein [Pseudomonas sp. WN033]